MIALHQGGFPHSRDHCSSLTPNPHQAIKSTHKVSTATNDVAEEIKIKDLKVCPHRDGVMDEGGEQLGAVEAVCIKGDWVMKQDHQ